MLPGLIRTGFTLFLAAALSACGIQERIEKIVPLPSFISGASGITYTVQLEGAMDPALRDLLEQNLELFTLKQDRPTSTAALRRRMGRDLEGAQIILRAEGYYAGKVDAAIDESDEPMDVTVTIEPGPRYTLASYEIVYIGDRQNPESLPNDPIQFGAKPGMPARGEDVAAVETALVERLGETGRPMSDVADRRAVVDHDTRTMQVTVQVDPGPPLGFGPLTIDSLESVDEKYIRRIVDWREGRTFDSRKLEEARRILANTTLFRSVRLNTADEPDADGRLAVTAKVEEAKHRTVAAGLNYSTAEGVGGALSWEHRNLFGREERFRLSAEVSEIRREGSGSFRKPHYFIRDQTLLLNGSARMQETDAFTETTAGGFGGLERKVREIWTLGAGGSIEYSFIEEDSGDSTYLVIGIPMTIGRDTTKDLLDPKRGTKSRIVVTPYFATIEQTETFTALEFSGSAYYALGAQRRFVPAIRTRIGSVFGADTVKIPANKRLYSGGGGSVRGFGFQTAGPLDIDGDPIGGRSVIETGLEFRTRITDNFGVVPFVEGGTVFDEPIPDFSEDLFWAAGLGLRYYTVAGPIRLDVAWPLNRRPEFDEDFQFYVSLGQAF